MGKKTKGRSVTGADEVKGTDDRTKGCRQEKKGEEVSERSQQVVEGSREEEKEIERAIDEMLNECQREAQERTERKNAYNPGGESRGQKRPLDPPGWGREEGGPSQAERGSKQSAGLGRGQHRLCAGGDPQSRTGEKKMFSQFARRPPSRLDLKPCREEMFLTEHGGHETWQMALKSACAKKESLWKDMSSALSQSLDVLTKTTRCGQSTEGLFPLPLPRGLGWCEEEDPLLEGLIRGLNRLYGVESSGGRKISKVQRRILERLSGVLKTSGLPSRPSPTYVWTVFHHKRH